MIMPQPDNRTPPKTREFAFSDEDFNALRTLVKAHTGINLTDQKRELVYGRISRRLRALDLDSFREYRELLTDESGKEFVEFCNAITTNLTSFFRESHHFDYVRDHILAPRVNDRARLAPAAHLVRRLLERRRALLARHDHPRNDSRRQPLGHPHSRDRSRLRGARARPARRLSAEPRARHAARRA